MNAPQVEAGRHAVRVTVVGEARRVDVTVPPATLAELLPDLVGLVEPEPDEGDGPRGWVLTRLDGVPLDLERSLAASGVLEGELLYLRRVADADEPAVVEDFAEAVATVVEASRGRWRACHLRALLIGLGAVGIAVGAATLLAPASGDGLPGASLPAAAAVALTAAAACLARLVRRPVPGAAMALAALPWYAAAGEHLVAAPGVAPALLAAGAGAGLLAGALAIWAAAPAVLGPAAAVVLAAGPLAAGAAIVGLGGATAEQAAVGLAVALSLVPNVLPAAAARGARLLRGAERAVEPSSVEAGVRRARRLLGWLLAGAGAALAPALAVLAFSPDAAGRLLCAAAILAVALRIRHHLFVTEIAPLALTAATGAALLAVALLAPAPSVTWTAAALAAGTGAIAGAALVRDARVDPHVRRWLGHAELAATAALPPLALWTLDVFGAINAWAHSL